ncbi:MAG: GGDEF domain-containing protein [Firmicutes bacterium HGW-Firmicutes-9]|jgi:diguanylate cyclase (GGDEF)-like protein|nr:MAG: GGDEF domain-containing protein [Firmicutes bacterium HGW-Firmicutes-9]
MLKFDSLEEAVEKTALFLEFCFGVRLIRQSDSVVLHASAPSLENHAMREVARIPVEICGENCALELIQPNRRVISAVFGESGRSGLMQDVSGAVGGLMHRDALTGLYNRRYIDETLPVALRTAHERGKALSLIFADIDRFKQVNDNHGHIAGDLVLQHIAQLMQKKISRAGSWVARYGGDEFIICLPGVEYHAAQRIANQLRLAIMNQQFPMDGGMIRLTCSFGVQSVQKFDSQHSALMLLHRADEKLYQAKHAGRNKVV